MLIKNNLINFIINFAPTGRIPTRAMTHHVPISVGEILEDEHEAFEPGITMIHLHARIESNGEPHIQDGNLSSYYRGNPKVFKRFGYVLLFERTGIQRIRKAARTGID